MKKKKAPEKAPNTDRWMLSYLDFITLLMVFFIILYAMSSVNSEKYSKLAASMNSAMGNGKSIIGEGSGGGKNVIGSSSTKVNINKEAEEAAQNQEMQKFKRMQAEINNYLVDNKLNGSITTYIDERGLVISFKNLLLFDSGSADVKADSVNELVQIGSYLNQIDNIIRVEGNTDNVPIKNSPQYKSNLELSSARADNVAEVLETNAKINPSRVTSISYGEYRPIGDNNTDVGKAKNRRVDIVLMNIKYNATENNTNPGDISK